jgi:hypothetical protein
MDNVSDPEKYIEKLLDAANTRSGSASKIGLSWFVALLVLWVGSIEPIVPKLQAIAHQDNKLSRVNVLLREYRQTHRLEPQQLPQVEFAKLHMKKNDAEQDLAQALREARIAFSVPGLSLNVPTRLAALVWCGLLFGLSLYLAASRRAVHVLIARAAALNVKKKSLPWKSETRRSCSHCLGGSVLCRLESGTA